MLKIDQNITDQISLQNYDYGARKHVRERTLQGLDATKGVVADKGGSRQNEGAGVPIPSHIFEGRWTDAALRDQAAAIAPHHVNFTSPSKSEKRLLEETRRYREKYN